MNMLLAGKLADFIEDRTVKMRSWNGGRSIAYANNADQCGTVGCAAGHLGVMEFDEFKKFAEKNPGDSSSGILLVKFGRKKLELTEREASTLFTPGGYDLKTSDEEKARLCAILRGQAPLKDGWLHE